MMREDESDRVARQGTAAWKRLKSCKSWTDWLQVGEAMQVGRDWAMHQAGTNEPKGKGYNTAFGEWLTRYKLDDMDKGDRSRLFSVMDNLPAIEEWRQRLTLTEKLALNHPQAVLRKWKAFMEPEKPKSDKPTLKDSVVNLSEEVAAKDAEIANLKAHVAELEAAREVQPAAGKNPLADLNAGQIVDYILGLKASTVKAIVHDLVKDAKPEPASGKPAKPPKAKATKKARQEAMDEGWKELTADIGRAIGGVNPVAVKTDEGFAAVTKKS